MPESLEHVPLEQLKLPGLGMASLAKLAEAGLLLAGDLLGYLPRAYLDSSQVCSIVDAPLAEWVVIEGRVLQKQTGMTRTGLRVFQILVDDGSGTIRAVWYNQAWVEDSVDKGQKVSLFGKIRFEKLGRTMNTPKLKVLDASGHEGGIEPSYRQAAGLASDKLRGWIRALIERLPEDDPLDLELAQRFGYPSRKQAFQLIHGPPDRLVAKDLQERVHPAFKRLVFDEFLAFQSRLAKRQRGREATEYPRLAPDTAFLVSLSRSLPFPLTADQDQVIQQLVDALARGRRLQAMVQGDVGCGKTVVGLALAGLFARAGYQVAMLCPTTVLAQQHHQTAQRLLGPLALSVQLLTAREEAGQQRQVRAALAAGEPGLVIGTHSLFQDELSFARLGLVLIDEQHRFGVDQRAALLKKGRHPHYLAFSATPIPRSLALSVYGDLDVLQIREKPAGRAPVRTILKKAVNRDQVLDFARARMDLGEGVFWVFPQIDDGEEEQERAYRSALATFEHFKEKALAKVGLVHGRMGKDEVAAAMQAFRQGELELLVATTVIEVGVDVPHASVIVIEGAERFGLSQIHQLRGRVGRGTGEGFCFLLPGGRLTQSGLERLQILRDCDDGFAIAEHDLQQRGAGDLLGRLQSGTAGFRYGDPWADRELMAAARRLARERLS